MIKENIGSNKAIKPQLSTLFPFLAKKHIQAIQLVRKVYMPRNFTLRFPERLWIWLGRE